MRKGPKKTVALSLPQACYDNIKRLAEEDCRTVPGYIRMVLRQYLRQPDDPNTQNKDGAPPDP